MNHPVDMHPEDLLDRELEGELTPEERSRLDAHTAWCTPCALVRQAAVDFANERQAAEGDTALIHRISAAALGSTAPFAAPMPAHRSSFVLSHPRRRRRAWAVAGVVLFAATEQRHRSGRFDTDSSRAFS